MKKCKAFALIALIFVMIFCSAGMGVRVAGATDYASMGKREFVLFLLSKGGESSNYPWYEPGFGDKYKEVMKKNSFGTEYPWALTSVEEFGFLKEKGVINYGQPMTVDGEDGPLYARIKKYNVETGYDKTYAAIKEEQLRKSLEIKNRKMWADSMLEGDSNSHGIMTEENIDEEVYSRTEGSEVVKGQELTAGSYDMEEPSGIAKTIMEFLCWLIYMLAEQIDSILSTGGIALDNVIFGRVAGYGVQPAGEDVYMTLFGFELTNGNPYGYIGALLFQRIRSYIYIFMSVFCLYKLVRIAAGGDYGKMRMDFSTFLQNALLSFSFIVLMPYIFEVYLYVRDILLKAITFGTLQDLFGTTGFLESFRLGAEAASFNIVPNIIYLGAVILSIVVAGIYIAYAMSMMIHFILFPFVCLRGISDRNAYKEWMTETVGLTIMPLIDGMLLIIPLTFSDMANGNLAFNLLSLVSCAMLLTARSQARKTLGIKDTGLDMGAMATVAGIAHLAKGIGRTVGKSVGKMGKGLGAAKESFDAAREDSKMAKMYEEDAKIPRVEEPGGASGGRAGGPSIPRNLAAYADINNFEKGPFKGNLDSATSARLYRERSKKGYYTAVKDAVGAVGAGAGGIVGGAGVGLAGAAIGAGAGAFTGESIQAALAFGDAGMDLGSSAGVAAGGVIGKASVAAADFSYKARKVVRSHLMGGTISALEEGDAWSGDVDIDNPPIVAESTGGAVGLSGNASGMASERVLNVRAHVKENAPGYYESFEKAGEKLKNPKTFLKDPEFKAKVTEVQTQMSSLVNRAATGTHPNEAIDGNGGLEQLRERINVEIISKCRSVAKAEVINNPNIVPSENAQTNADTVSAMTSMLVQEGKFMTDEFYKELGLDWEAMRQRIIDEGANHGHVYNGKK